MKDLFAYLFGDSQVESEAEETKAVIERIMEEAEEQEPLKVKRTPLIAALKALGLKDVSSEVQYDPEGFSLVCGEESEYREYVRLLMEPDAMEKLAKLGWVVTRCGDVAMSSEPAEFRIRFLEITTVDTDSKDEWPTSNQKLIKSVIKKGREFMDEPGPHDTDGPVEYDDKTSDDHKKGVGKEQDGKDPEGKPKGAVKEAQEEEKSVYALCRGCGNEENARYAGQTCPECHETTMSIEPGTHQLWPRRWTTKADREKWKQRCLASSKTEALELAESIVNETESPKGALRRERCPHCEGCGYVDDEGNPRSEDEYTLRREDRMNPVHLCHVCKGTRSVPTAQAGPYKAGVERSVSQTLGRPYKFGEAGHAAGCQCGFCKNKGSFGKKAKEEKDKPEGDDDDDTGTKDEAQEEVPYVDKTGKQRKVPWVRRPQPKVTPKQEAEPPRYGDMYQLIDERKQKAQKVNKAYKLRRKA